MSVVSRLTKIAARRLLPDSVYTEQLNNQHQSKKQVVVFPTFDDGPHPVHTPRILDTLAEYNAHATFFVIGEYAQRHPEVVKQTLAAGHSIGNHSWSHWNANNVSPARYVDDVIRGRDVIEQITGSTCRLFRPPYGDLNPFVLKSLVHHRFQIIQWSLDPKDFNAQSETEISSWFASTTPLPGNIVLMHDNQEFTANGLSDALQHWQPGVEFHSIPMQS